MKYTLLLSILLLSCTKNNKPADDFTDGPQPEKRCYTCEVIQRDYICETREHVPVCGMTPSGIQSYMDSVNGPSQYLHRSAKCW